MNELFNEIMNIPAIMDFDCREYPQEARMYRIAHQDALSKAAELSLKADARIEELEVYEKFAIYLLNQSKLQGGSFYEDNLAYFRGIK